MRRPGWIEITCGAEEHGLDHWEKDERDCMRLKPLDCAFSCWCRVGNTNVYDVLAFILSWGTSRGIWIFISLSSFRLNSSIEYSSPNDTMGSYHGHAPWRKAVLVPFWTIQLLVGLLDLALLGLAVGIIVRWEHGNGNCDNDFNCNFDDNVSTEAKMYVVVSIFRLASANGLIVLYQYG